MKVANNWNVNVKVASETNHGLKSVIFRNYSNCGEIKVISNTKKIIHIKMLIYFLKY